MDGSSIFDCQFGVSVPQVGFTAEKRVGLCRSSTCSNPAAFMIRNTTGSMKAFGRQHPIRLAVAESELPDQERG